MPVKESIRYCSGHLFVGSAAVYTGSVHRRNDDEKLYVVEGELTLIGEAGERRAGLGSFMPFAPGDLHGYRNDGAGTALVLVLAQPGVQFPTTG